MSLTHGIVPIGAAVLTIVLLAAAMAALAVTSSAHSPGRRRCLFAVSTAVAAIAVLAGGQAAFGWIDVAMLPSYYLCLAAPVAGLCLLVASAIPREWLGRGVAAAAEPRVRRTVAAVLAALVVPLGASLTALRINQTYDYYPTLASLEGGGLGARVVGAHDLSRVTAPSSRDTGRRVDEPLLVRADIPGTLSHFRARDAYLWLPPAYLRGVRRGLPVLMLLHGTPGRPDDWLRAGGLAATARAYSEAHDGAGPIVVMPDINGATWADTECVNSPRGNVETYLTSDVPNWVSARLGLPESASWSIGGLSEGGTCAAVLALRHPGRFARFADLSGLADPTVGDHVQPQATVRTLFGGAWTSYLAHSPVWLLDHRAPRELQAIFAVGTHDAASLRAQRLIAGAARAHGLATRTLVLPGGHDWYLWRVALRRIYGDLVGPDTVGPCCGAPAGRPGSSRTTSAPGPRTMTGKADRHGHGRDPRRRQDR